ncbi:hypothetical protein ACH5RR_009677 [Cinchona calisaya]|uniref:F-box domain-containing protein n=1 Tax=Cinchona calisaya TaxID=153742 RepID=A0ABD3AHZ3_9GENT
MMSSSCCSISTNTTTADHGGATAITAVHPDIIQTHILTRLDGPTLASTSCASSNLHSLCTEENLWKKICNTNWPSTANPCIQETVSKFPSGHRTFYSDSYPTLHNHHHHSRRQTCNGSLGVIQPSELISAVDIHYGNELVYSKVVVTETLSSWFTCSPFRIDLLDRQEETVLMPVKFDGEEGKCMREVEENLRLSWIVIDPSRNRAVNLSSIRPVEVRRHWLTGEIQVCYATVMATGGGAAGGGGFVNFKVVVTCGAKGGGDLQVMEVSVQAEDMEGKIIGGKDSLVILHEAMEGKRRKGVDGEGKKIYEMFLEIRREWRERKQNRERRLDMVCVSIGVGIFMAFLMFIFFR